MGLLYIESIFEVYHIKSEMSTCSIFEKLIVIIIDLMGKIW